MCEIFVELLKYLIIVWLAFGGITREKKMNLNGGMSGCVSILKNTEKTRRMSN